MLLWCTYWDELDLHHSAVTSDDLFRDRSGVIKHVTWLKHPIITCKHISNSITIVIILSQSKVAYNHPLTWQCIDKSIKIVINIFTICVYSKYHEVWHNCKQVRPGATPYSQMQCQLPRHLYFITHGITMGHGLLSSLESSLLIRGQGSWWVLPKYASI